MLDPGRGRRDVARPATGRILCTLALNYTYVLYSHQPLQFYKLQAASLRGHASTTPSYSQHRHHGTCVTPTPLWYPLALHMHRIWIQARPGDPKPQVEPLHSWGGPLADCCAASHGPHLVVYPTTITPGELPRAKAAWQAHGAPVTALHASPYGMQLVSGAGDGSVHLCVPFA